MSAGNVAIAPANTIDYASMKANFSELSEDFSTDVIIFATQVLSDVSTLQTKNQLTERIQSHIKVFLASRAECANYKKEISGLRVSIATFSKYQSETDEQVTTATNLVKKLTAERDQIKIVMKMESELNAIENELQIAKASVRQCENAEDTTILATLKERAADFELSAEQLKSKLEEQKNILKKMEGERSVSKGMGNQKKLDFLELNLRAALETQSNAHILQAKTESDIKVKTQQLLTLENLRLRHIIFMQRALMSIRLELDQQKAAPAQTTAAAQTAAADQTAAAAKT